jgi:16S rRNA (uracil1498-N3)-methyltransferase
MITLLLPPDRWAAEEITLDGEAYHHLFRVRRAERGERLRLVDGRGRARWGEVAAVERKTARVVLQDSAPDHEPARRVTLLVTTLRPERASWLVEKATELGVFAIRFLQSERAPRTFGEGTVERLRRVAAAAVEQCHRARCPEISGTHDWSELASLTADCAERWLFDTAVPAGSGAAEPAASLALLIGPEGGWSDRERRELAAWHPLSLGERVLRTETAAIVGIAFALR